MGEQRQEWHSTGARHTSARRARGKERWFVSRERSPTDLFNPPNVPGRVLPVSVRFTLDLLKPKETPTTLTN